MSDKQNKSPNALDVKTEGILDTLPAYIATFLFASTVILVTANFLVRSLSLDFLSGYVFWAVPLSRYVLIVMTYMGLAVAMRNNETVKIDLLQRLLKDRMPRLYHLNIFLIVILIAAFAALTLYGSAMSALETWGSTTDMPFISVGMVHLGIAIGMVFIGIYISYDLIQYARLAISKAVNKDIKFNRYTIMSRVEIDTIEKDSEDEELSEVRAAMGLEEEE